MPRMQEAGVLQRQNCPAVQEKHRSLLLAWLAQQGVKPLCMHNNGI